MGEEEEEAAALTNHFWKFMWPGFRRQLRLPPAFCGKLKEEMSNWAILRSDRGRTRVGVCKDDNGGICFKEGWKDFALKNGLNVGDALVFKHAGRLRFDVTVYEETGCEKELPQGENLHERPKLAKKKPTRDSITSYNSPNPHFTRMMTPNNGNKRCGSANIPASFVRSNDLSRKTSATLRDSRGRTWPVSLLFAKKGGMRCLMSTGWYAFYKSNELKDGDFCVFELHPHSPQSSTFVMDVKIIRGDDS